MTATAPAPTRPGAPPRRGASPAAVALLVVVVIGTSLVALGPRWVVVDGETSVGHWLGRHPTADALVTALGGLQATGNLLLFAPLALLLAVVVSRRRMPLAVVLTALAPTAVEATQIALPGRVPDPDDIVLNTLGLALAFGAGLVLRGLRTISVPRRRDQCSS